MIVSHPPKPESSSKVALSIVVPVYKEAGNIRPFLERSEAVMARMGVSYEIIFALDPSPDDTEAVILREIRCCRPVRTSGCDEGRNPELPRREMRRDRRRSAGPTRIDRATLQ